MKFLKKLLLSLFVFALIFNTKIILPVNATTINSCDPNIHTYSVETLTYNASTSSIDYTIQACYASNEYGNAVSKFNEIVNNGTTNVVIKYNSTDDTEFQSPLKIIRSDRAMAYTQNFTYTVGDLTTENGVTYASTIGIYNDAQLTSRYTYVDNKEPLFYYTTDLKDSNSAAKPSNMVSYVEINGAKGYIKLTGIDIVPLIYAENRVLIPFYVKLSTQATKTLYVRLNGSIGIYPLPPQYVVSSGEIAVSVDRATTLDNIGVYGKAPSWLPNGTYYSADGIKFYTDMALRNPVLNGSSQGEFYNYYNYLSLRTKTSITGSQFDQYLLNNLATTYKDGGTNDSVMISQGTSFINSQETYGMNALLIYSMALLESGKGTSDISLSKKNIFSVNAVDSNTGLAYTFSSVEEAVSMQMGIYLRYYMDINSTKFYGSNIGNKGAGFNTMYASDAFWSTKIAKYAYLIDKTYGLNDYNKYTLALLKPSVSSTLYKDRNLTTSLYSIPSRAKNYPVTLTAQYNSTYYTQSTSPIINNQLVTNSTSGLINYDWHNSLAYLNANQVSILNSPTTSIQVITGTDELLSRITNFEWIDENTFFIKGRSVLLSTAMPLEELTNQKLIIVNKSSGAEYEFDLNVLEEQYDYFNNLDYNFAGFEGTINISNLLDGSYLLKLKTSYGDTSGQILISDFSNNPIRPTNTISSSGILSKFELDNWNSMQFNYLRQSSLGDYQISTSLPTEYISFAKTSSFELTNENFLNIRGISYILGKNMDNTSQKEGKLILIDKINSSNINSYELIFDNNGYDPSYGSNNYSYSWFSTQIDLSTINLTSYKVLIFLEIDGIKDLFEVRDFSYTNNYSISNTNYTVDISYNQVERYSLNLNIR